ncbi:hypothetical protein NEOLEDRAFT_1147230 [Neolentinus lepideus HHB14362 ss-1]|uniref:Arrestin-like N-terminal domain-containing protein n=1 Tax=Neolentinus lepideus HHB14362 ss-1 TaxID=1314782 RepID=A0A165TF95_9AGAM|nr:hypothetical protein NEOLEDRAFT_1147230 [Neolentinus lepideus HHB14362 ss-1]
MSVSLEIHPLSDSLEFYGHPDPSSAYSLSGHVSISLSTVSSFFERCRAVRLLLHSLTITFEGQTELVTVETGYSGMRLCSITRELAPAEPIELNNEGQEDSGTPCVWNAVFNIQVPGWLPSSDRFGDLSDNVAAGTSYSLHATARFTNIGESPTKSWLMSTLCTPFRSKARVVRAPQKTIIIQRFIPTSSMASSSTSLFPLATFVASVSPDVPEEERDTSWIPQSILSNIQVLASVPSHIDVNEISFPLTLRLRARDLSVEDRKKLRFVDFTVEVEQVERYRVSPSSEYTSRSPLPPRALQPPHMPLRNPHPMCTLHDLGFATEGPNPSATRSFSILSQEHSGHYVLTGDGHVFTDSETEGERSNQWFNMQAQVPLGISDEIVQAKDWAGPKKLRQTEEGPLFSVRHKLHLSLTYTYDVDEEDTDAREEDALIGGNTTEPKRAEGRVGFSVPLDFVRLDPRVAQCCTPPLSPVSSISSPSSSTSSLSLNMPCPLDASPLPPYSQLYDSNGERKIDYSTPLPLYTPPSQPFIASWG